MIHESLKFLTEEINQYFEIKLGATTEKRVVLGNITYANNKAPDGNSGIAEKVVASLVNIEEDKVSKFQETNIRINQRRVYENPPVPLNLYVLFSVNRTDYDDCLRWISLIMEYFQQQNVFTPQTYPALNAKIKKLIVEFYPLSFEQINHLWSILDGKYIPSVLFKIKQINIDEAFISGEGQPIQEI